MAEIKKLLTEKRDFLLGMMENPNLLEHEKFTEMLLALFHVQEELMFRGDSNALPKSDIAHLNKDVNRAFGLIIREWIMHMRHLQNNYSYLFSLATRTNPFDPRGGGNSEGMRVITSWSRMERRIALQSNVTIQMKLRRRLMRAFAP